MHPDESRDRILLDLKQISLKTRKITTGPVVEVDVFIQRRGERR